MKCMDCGTEYEPVRRVAGNDDFPFGPEFCAHDVQQCRDALKAKLAERDAEIARLREALLAARYGKDENGGSRDVWIGERKIDQVLSSDAVSIVDAIHSLAASPAPSEHTELCDDPQCLACAARQTRIESPAPTKLVGLAAAEAHFGEGVGRIASSNAFSPTEIAIARSESRLFVDDDGLGFMGSGPVVLPSPIESGAHIPKPEEPK